MKRGDCSMAWSEIGFGKRHPRLTLPQIVFRDPDWFFWAIEDSVFRDKPTRRQAEDIDYRARNIRIPDRFPNHIVQYVVNQPTDKFQDMHIIPEDAHRYQGAIYKDVIDLSTMREFSNYDKSGGTQLIKGAKYFLFGDASARMTKSRCESFFDEPDNFEWATE